MSGLISLDAFVEQTFPGDRTRVADGWAVTCPACGTADSLRVRELGDLVAVGCFTRDCPGKIHEALGMTEAKWLAVLDTVRTTVAEEGEEEEEGAARPEEEGPQEPSLPPPESREEEEAPAPKKRGRPRKKRPPEPPKKGGGPAAKAQGGKAPGARTAPALSTAGPRRAGPAKG